MRHEQFIEYYEQYKDKVYSFIYYRVDRDTELAEDLTSDVFVKAFEKSGSYDDRFAFSTWIYTMARNIVIDHYRKTRNDEGDKEIGITDEMMNMIEGDDEIGMLQADMDSEHTRDVIFQALETLPEFQKDCLIMKHLEDMDNREIAQVTEKTEANVRQALSRAAKKIRPMLQTLLQFILISLSPILTLF